MAHASTVIARCTTRVLAGRNGAEPHSVGTGFFFMLRSATTPGQIVTLVITNKHVVQGCDFARFVISSVPKGSSVSPDELVGPPLLAQHSITVPLHDPLLIPHPAPDIDLCALLCSEAVGGLDASGRDLYAAFLDESVFLPSAERSWVRFIEPVVMVGYPNGLWDHVHDMPIIRQGSTATHALQAHRGRPEFVIDMACMGGSSGSPVFLFEDGLVRNGPQSVGPGTRFALLGVLWGGPQVDLQGRIEVRPVPHAVQPVPVTSAPMNLGYVISADQLRLLLNQVATRLGFT